MRPSRHAISGHRPAPRALLLTLVVCLACRSGGVRGEYTSGDGAVFNFKPNGKVEMTMGKIFGMQPPTQELDYAVEDGKIMLGVPGQPRLVIPIDENGCFVFNMGLTEDKMCKAGSPGAKPRT
jgi:hypothetical protein